MHSALRPEASTFSPLISVIAKLSSEDWQTDSQDDPAVLHMPRAFIPLSPLLMEHSSMLLPSMAS